MSASGGSGASGGGPIAARIAGTEPVGALSPALGELRGRAWVVGGTVRDAHLGRELWDIDIALDAAPKPVATALAQRAGADVFLMSDRFETWRVSSASGWQVDLCRLRAPTIEADLQLRDLTINALAVPLEGGELIDPTGGLADLEAARMRAASERSFYDDPLRLLRLARFAAELGFEPAPETVELARRSAGRAGEPAGERQFAELRALIGSADPIRGLELCEALGITAPILPELHELRGVGQSANHHLDVYGHTIEVLRRWLEIESDLAAYAGPAADAVTAAIAEPLADGLSRREGIRFSAILHDIGKPATRIERDGWVSFKGHDREGAELVKGLCSRLRTSRRFADFQAALCRHHLALGFMVRERPLPPRRVWEYLTLCGREAIDVTLLTIADRLSAQGGGVPPEAIDGHIALAGEMLAAASELDRTGPPTPLLAGGEIGWLVGIGAGPMLGEAVRELAAAQYAGEVTDREAAVEWLREWASAAEPE